jgi:hypothetical protein
VQIHKLYSYYKQILQKMSNIEGLYYWNNKKIILFHIQLYLILYILDITNLKYLNCCLKSAFQMCEGVKS